MNTQPSKLFLRRAEACIFLGLPARQFAKLVDAEVIEQRHLVWQVEVRVKGKPMRFETSKKKAEEYCQKHKTAIMRPLGKAYFATADLVEFAANQGSGAGAVK